MIVNGKKYVLEDLVKDIDFTKNSLSKTKEGLMLTNDEMNILDRNFIDYQSSNSLKDIMIKIEDILEDEALDDDDADDLEYVLKSISERDYYQNTLK